jgi:hypothetical protein
MKSDQELLLLRLTQNFKPFPLMLVYDWAKSARGLPARFCDFNQNHASVRRVGQSPYIRLAFERVEQTRDSRSADDEPISDFIGR